MGSGGECFTASSDLIRRSHIKNIVDLPCGYTPRGLELMESGSVYHGLDLPAVIRVMDRDQAEG